MKLCSVCGKTKPESDYYRNGAGTPINPCKACRLESCRRSREMNKVIHSSKSSEQIIAEIFMAYTAGSSFEPCEVDNKKFVFAMQF